MDITRHNFAENFDKIDKLISKSDFVSIDCEFSGLFQKKTNNLDNYEQFYTNSKENLQQFQIFQVGLTFFTKKEDDEFDCYLFNFYIYPSKCVYASKEFRERYFLSQASSLKFLIENGFDFNKVIRDGISYVPLSQFTSVEEKIRNKINGDSDEKPNFIEIDSEEDRKFINEISEKIDEFMKSDDQQELVFPQQNSFYRRLIYEMIQKSPHKNRLKTFTGKNENKGSVIVQKAFQRNKQEEIKSMVMENVGFALLIKSMIQHKIPLIGHGIFTDLLYIYQAFISTLPEDYQEFKTSMHGCFETIYDTLFLCNSSNFESLIPFSALEKLHSSVMIEPFLSTKFHLKNCIDDHDRKFHEAGYDSFVTGCCFIQMARYLCSKDSGNDANIFNNKILDQYKNKIAVYGIHDLKYINLQGQDIPLNRDKILHIEVPKNFNQKDINLIFAEFGGLARTFWIDEKSANCVLKDESKIADVVKSLILNAQPSLPYKLQLYSDYIKNGNDLKPVVCMDKRIKSDQESNSEQKESKPIKKIKMDVTILDEEPSNMNIDDKLFEDNSCWPANS